MCVIVPSETSSLATPAERERCEQDMTRVLTDHNIPVDAVVFRDRIPLDPRHHSKVEYDVLRKEILKEVAA